MGGLAAHSVRSAPQYFPLFIISCFAASGFLALVSPRDKTFLGLYRSSALILIIGALFPFWDLLMLIPQQILIGAVSAVFVGAIALIAILGRINHGFPENSSSQRFIWRHSLLRIGDRYYPR